MADANTAADAAAETNPPAETTIDPGLSAELTTGLDDVGLGGVDSSVDSSVIAKNDASSEPKITAGTQDTGKQTTGRKSEKKKAAAAKPAGNKPKRATKKKTANGPTNQPTAAEPTGPWEPIGPKSRHEEFDAELRTVVLWEKQLLECQATGHRKWVRNPVGEPPANEATAAE